MKPSVYLSLITIVVIFSLSCAGDSSLGSLPEVLYSENFSSYNVGDTISADWKDIVGGAIGNLIQLSDKTLRLAPGATMAVYDGIDTATWTDYTLKFRFYCDTDDGTFGIYLRTDPQAENANAYYQLNLQYNTDHYEYSLVKNTSAIGSNTPLTSATSGTIAWDADIWYIFTVKVSGGNIKAYMKGSSTPFLNYTDSSDVITNGGFGFMRSGGYMYIDDITVTEL